MIEIIVIISFIVFAIHYTMLPGEIFGFVERWWKAMEDKILERASSCTKEAEFLQDEINRGVYGSKENKYELIKYNKKCEDQLLKKTLSLEKLSQPLFRCPVCMAPYYGTALYWLIPWQRIGLMPHDWVAWLVVIFGALGLNAILVKLFPDKDD